MEEIRLYCAGFVFFFLNWFLNQLNQCIQESLTPMFTCSQKIYDVGMMTKFTKDFEFSSKVSVVIFWSILWKSNQHAFMFSFELNLRLLLIMRTLGCLGHYCFISNRKRKILRYINIYLQEYKFSKEKIKGENLMSVATIYQEWKHLNTLHLVSLIWECRSNSRSYCN